MYSVIGANCDGAFTQGYADTLDEAKKIAQAGQAYSDSIGNPYGTTYSVHLHYRVVYRTQSSIK